jgi:acyl-CoA thioesterase II
MNFTARDELMTEMLAALQLEPVGENIYHATLVKPSPGTLFGGQMLAQAIVAAGRDHPTMRVKSIQIVFARPARADQPADITVETIHSGRNFASSSIDFCQDARVCARALVLLHTCEPDLIRHQPSMPVVAPPDDASATAQPLAAPDTIVVGDVDILNPGATGPAEIALWVRFPTDKADDPLVSQALLAHATDGWLIGAAMRPHAGIGQSMAHKEISTGVVSHSLSFHDEFSAAQWCLIDQRSVFAGNGRAFGTADVFTQTGRYIASFSQDAIVRRLPSQKIMGAM